ncbi:MAG: nitrate reductase cytochrome c-type subunit [Gammaproteobacteria bacterium]|nr:nitrate reductase cytochrome c-type subunit [Gammaproteobacteria bacterium]
MNKHISVVLMTAVLASSLGGVASAEVKSLRGVNAVDSLSDAAEVKPYLKDNQPIPRDYLQQPPLIPHKIDGYLINIKHNKCLGCHSWKNYREHNATKISQTHFENRDGAVLSNVSALRYFCTQCHVPQADAKPLVENTFQPVDTMVLR